MSKYYNLKLFCLIYYYSNGSGFGVYKPYFDLNGILPNWLRMLLDHSQINQFNGTLRRRTYIYNPYNI